MRITIHILFILKEEINMQDGGSNDYVVTMELEMIFIVIM
jgi:hypothetical protein